MQVLALIIIRQLQHNSDKNSLACISCFSSAFPFVLLGITEETRSTHTFTFTDCGTKCLKEQLFVLADLHRICHELSYFPLRVKSCVLKSVRSDSLTESHRWRQFFKLLYITFTFEELRWVSGVLPGSLI